MSINVSRVALASIHAFPPRDTGRFVFMALPMTHTRINIKKTGNSNKNKEKNKEEKNVPLWTLKEILKSLFWVIQSTVF